MSIHSVGNHVVDHFVGIDNVSDRSIPVSRAELREAIEMNDMTALGELLCHDVVDVVGDNQGGMSPLFYAVSMQNVEACKLLVSNKNINVNEKCFGDSPIYKSINMVGLSMIDVASVLLSRDDLDLSFFNAYSKETPFSCVMNEIRKADVAIGRNSFDADFQKERRNAYEDIAIKLVAHPKFNVDEVFIKEAEAAGFTTLTYFAGLPGCERVFDALLMRSGTAVNAKDSHGDMPIVRAISAQIEGNVLSLLSHFDFSDLIELRDGGELRPVFEELSDRTVEFLNVYNIVNCLESEDEKIQVDARVAFNEYGAERAISCLMNNRNIYNVYQVVAEYCSLKASARKNENVDSLRLMMGVYADKEIVVETVIDRWIDGLLQDETVPM